MSNNETILSLFELIGLSNDTTSAKLDSLAEVDYRYLRDLKVNVGNVLTSENLSEKETVLIALSVVANANHPALISGFKKVVLSKGGTEEEIAEILSCASLLATNNVLYRFRHFMQSNTYNQLPG